MRFEYHIPSEYSSSRPGFVYRTTEHNETMTDNPMASRLPRGGSHLEVFGSTKDFTALACRSENPTHVRDRALTDLPPLFIHHLNFSDGTLLVISFPHSFMDLGALRAFFCGWMSVLNGQEDQVPQLRDLADDPRISLAHGTPAKTYILKEHVRPRFQCLIPRVWRYVMNLWSPKKQQKETRMVCVPGDFVKTLKQKALDDLASQNNGQGKAITFVSQNDVMLAWYTRIMLSVLDPPPEKPLLINNAYDARPVCFPKDQACLLDCSFYLRTRTTVGKWMEKPLGIAAAELRQSLIQQRTPEQTEAYAALAKESMEATGKSPSFGPPDALTFLWANDDAGRLFHVDFSSAVRKPETVRGRRADSFGKPSLVMDIADLTNVGNIAIVQGLDHDGNWWMEWQMSDDNWRKVGEQLRAINMHRKGE